MPDEKFEDRRRYTPHGLTEEQMAKVAEIAAERAMLLMRDNFYRGIGAQVVSRFMWLIGACAVGLYLFLDWRGWIK